MRIKIKQAEIQLSKAQLKFVEAANKKLASAMKLENLDAIEQRTGHPYRTLKILLSLYRRLRTLAGYQNSGKADFES